MEHMIYLERKRFYSHVLWSLKNVQCHGILCATVWHYNDDFGYFFHFSLLAIRHRRQHTVYNKMPALLISCSFWCMHTTSTYVSNWDALEKKYRFNCFEWNVPFFFYILPAIWKFEFFVFLLGGRSTTYFSTLNAIFVNEQWAQALSTHWVWSVNRDTTLIPKT